MDEKSKQPIVLDDSNMVNLARLNKNYYTDAINTLESEIIKLQDTINMKLGTKEVETGLSPPYL
ncbi:hypothetical protein ECANGB1_2452 [Enterospora canceri]|uniref:Uncharacterized protein n=1 Tax=Enterospora canceri TaxID=1081671 RepID=A0A1Y1S9M9_9MICR|nr:hypothetical protein ECANGB1_2452 [Enterospora canceri]